MRSLALVTGLLCSSAASATCIAYDPASPSPRIDFYRCLDAAVVDLQASVADLSADVGLIGSDVEVHEGRIAALETMLQPDDAGRAVLTADGGVRTGNAIEGLLETSLPANGESYESAPLHMKTDWICGETAGVMYNLEFVGHDFTAISEINIIAVGYMYGVYGHTYDNVRVLSGSSSMDTYCSPVDGRLVFRLYPGAADFHASGLRVNFMGGGSGYLANGADSITFIQIDHSAGEI